MKRKIHFRKNWLIILGIWGAAELILRIWVAKEKYFQGTEEFSFMDLGRSVHYFPGLREHRPPPPSGGLHITIINMHVMYHQNISKCIRVFEHTKFPLYVLSREIFKAGSEGEHSCLQMTQHLHLMCMPTDNHQYILKGLKVIERTSFPLSSLFKRDNDKRVVRGSNHSCIGHILT